MASSSSSSASSSQGPQWKYDVFLSFRGKDTRKTITGHLYEGLKKREIFTFQDDKRLELGDSIPEELLKAIEESQVSLVVFSKNYATSRWCLNELVKIMECKDKNGQTVIPIFYDVDATEVRNQSESFAIAFAEHEKKYKDDAEGMQKVRGWRTALTAAANLKGSAVFHGGVESDYIEHIIARISSICKTSISYLQKVVGIDTQLKEVESLLEMEIDDVRIVWICGMGGVGKTTIAKTIFYDTLSSKFKDACFLEDIKENKHRIHSLQNILLSKLVGEKENCVDNKEDGIKLMACRLRFKKVLVVLDDIDHTDQLDYLAGDLGWFGKGSRIIATTRDKHLIGKYDGVHEVTTLLEHDAIKLFNQCAFRKEVPDECFKDLTLELVSHAKRLPLALKVWGSLLHGKNKREWESAVDRIKKNPGLKIIGNLKISYDALEPDDQEIFLDIACFLRGYKKKEVKKILESCGFQAEYGLSVLIDKSLLFISEKDTIEMHDLIQDMGKYVVNLPKDLGERSRLWDVEQIKEVMINYTGTKVVEAIWAEHVLDEICFSKEAMKNMKMLRILYIRTDNYSTCDDGVIEYLSNNLCWFVWRYYPWKSLPAKFEPKKLVHLELHQSKLCQLWPERKFFPCLRELHLSYSESLMRTPDFREMPNLEYLDLSYCINLEEVDDSLRYCGKLIRLNLGYCSSLKRFPCVKLESFEYLGLRCCSSLEKFPEIKGRSKLGLQISMNFSKVRVELDVFGCSKLESLPEEIGDLENLEKLDASCTLISRPPSSIARLNKLKFLSFTKNISEVGLQDRVCFVFPSVNHGLRSLKCLDIDYCNLIDGGLPEDIGSLSSLKELSLVGNNFEHLPRSIAQLGTLEYLDLSDCKRLKELPGFMGMPNLKYLNLVSCDDLEEVDDSLGYCGKLIQLHLDYCKSLKRFPCVNVESLEFLNLQDCSSLEKFPEIRGIMNPKLKINIKGSGIRELPSFFYLRFMKHLVGLPIRIGILKSLVS